MPIEGYPTCKGGMEVLIAAFFFYLPDLKELGRVAHR